jgi:hypothetical protein
MSNDKHHQTNKMSLQTIPITQPLAVLLTTHKPNNAFEALLTVMGFIKSASIAGESVVPRKTFKSMCKTLERMQGNYTEHERECAMHMIDNFYAN